MPVPAFTFKHLRFELRIGFALLVLAVCAVMLRAGFWQLDRAAEKIRMQAELEAAMRQPVLHVFGDLPPAQGLRYRRLRINGQYLSAKQFLLDNKIKNTDGRAEAGYHVITPLQTEAGLLLVDRGWVPLGADRTRLPAIEIDDRERSVTGVVDLPGRGFSLGAIDSGGHWPRVIQFLDYELLSQRLGAPVYPALLILAAGRDDGYQYNWQAVAEGPQKHYSYAMQWFLMCGAVMLMFIIFSVKRVKP